MILKYYLFYLFRRDYTLKTIFNYEGTLYRKRDYDLKNTLNSEGTEKRRRIEERLANTSQEREKRERVLGNSIELLDVFFELSGVLYLCRDSVTVLAKIATTITLMDKVKMKFIH